jgi:hypothetical protein
MKTIVLDRYVLESLMVDLVGHDRRPAAFLLYLALTRLVETKPAPRSACAIWHPPPAFPAPRCSGESGISNGAA